MRLTLHFDGSCWPNPGGLAKYGWTLHTPSGDHSGHGFAGEGPHVSNNYAEFYAMAEGLSLALAVVRHGGSIEVLGDSEVAIKIMQGAYKARKDKLYWPQYDRCMKLLKCLHDLGIYVEFKWIPREQNQEADTLSKLLTTDPVSPVLIEEAEELLK